MSRGATNKQQGRARIDRKGLGRRLHAAVAGICVMASIGLVTAGAWQLWQIPVERVVFSGDVQRISQPELQSLVNENLNAGFLSVNIEQIRDSIEAYPWVFKAVVKRRWPSHLEIEVTGQLPIARWGESAYLNHQGEVFRPDIYEAMPELPYLDGPVGSQLQLMQHYQLMRERIQVLDLDVVSLSMNARGGLAAKLHTGSELIFGRGQLDEKLARFIGVYYADLADKAATIRAVDLRYRHGLAVSWRAGELDV